MKRRKNLPNILTVSRIFLALGFIFFFTQAGLASLIVASLLFVLAAITDFYDGYYARKYDLISNFGKIMDPIADKFLTLAAFYLFAQLHIVAQWMFSAILFRELVVTGVRFLAMRRGQVLAAEKSGKTKTVLQISSIIVILIYLMLKESGIFQSMGVATGYDWLGTWGLVIYLLMSLTVVLTLFSGIEYFWNNRRALRLRATA